MGMSNSDDEQKIMEDRADLEHHFKNSPPSEKLKYDRMTDDQRAHYEASVKDKQKRG
jgi:hypothetical protein